MYLKLYKLECENRIVKFCILCLFVDGIIYIRVGKLFGYSYFLWS